MRFPHLFTPIRIATRHFDNRVIMGSMHTGLEDHESEFDRLGRYFQARARGLGPGLMITGGFSPNNCGRLESGSGTLQHHSQVAAHRQLTEMVHSEGGAICLQVLHSGRYGHHADIVSASAIRSPINRITPRALGTDEVWEQIDDFINCIVLAREAGYDGVEIMGSEGYLINQFLCERTNQREDLFGGSMKNRQRLALEILSRARRAVSTDFILIFRLSIMDLVEGGSTREEVCDLAGRLGETGADLVNCGIGWHEARIPTISGAVPHAAFAEQVKAVRQVVNVPVVATNRINSPELAEDLLARGTCDMISMARPFLADAELVQKARAGDSAAINTCIACNQACLDQIFSGQFASCLVNPAAANEQAWEVSPAPAPQRIAVIGAGPAGLSAALSCARRGHRVTLFESTSQLGGQFTMAGRVPGKSDYLKTIRYFEEMLDRHGVEVECGCFVDDEFIVRSDFGDRFESVIVCSGVMPRRIELQGMETNQVVYYDELLSGQVEAGKRVAIIGAGGIGFDVASYLLGETMSTAEDYFRQWGIRLDSTHGGFLEEPDIEQPLREITLLSRTPGPMGKTLGKTTGWSHRLHLMSHGVNQVSGVDYREVTSEGLEVQLEGSTRTIAADTIVICAGQLENNRLVESLEKKCPALQIHVVGGALKAAELDAQRAIHDAAALGLRL